MNEPSECYEDQGGCGRASSFKFLTNLSEFIDAEKLQLQENPEGLKGSEQPQTIEKTWKEIKVGYNVVY